jgi:hypothetical protein
MLGSSQAKQRTVTALVVRKSQPDPPRSRDYGSLRTATGARGRIFWPRKARPARIPADRFRRSDLDLSREDFTRSITRICEHEFPDENLESVTTAADLEHSLSGNYVRGIFGRGREFWALFAVPENEAGEDPARCLTFALLWLGRLRQSSSHKNVAGLRILLPANSAVPVAHFLPACIPN